MKNIKKIVIEIYRKVLDHKQITSQHSPMGSYSVIRWEQFLRRCRYEQIQHVIHERRQIEYIYKKKYVLVFIMIFLLVYYIIPNFMGSYIVKQCCHTLVMHFITWRKLIFIIKIKKYLFFIYLVKNAAFIPKGHVNALQTTSPPTIFSSDCITLYSCILMYLFTSM